MAAWTPEGEILLAGRLDRQVKLRGLRIEPQEVADCISSYPGVKEAAARVCQMNGQMVLAAYYCSDTGIPEMELLSYAAAYLPKYMIPSFLIRLDRLPLTPSGKVDEERLPLPREDVQVSAASDDILTGQVLEIFRTVLEQPEMGKDNDYFLCGGNSLNAMEVLARLEDLTGRLLRISDLYACRSAERLSRFIGGEQETGREERHKEKLRPARSWNVIRSRPSSRGSMYSPAWTRRALPIICPALSGSAAKWNRKSWRRRSVR